MVIHSEFLDSLTPSAIRSITAKIRDKAKQGEKVVSFAGGLPSAEFFPIEDLKKSMSRSLRRKPARRSNMPPPTAMTRSENTWSRSWSASRSPV